MKWFARIEYDEGRIGRATMFGLDSRDAAIKWLERAFVWKLCWYKRPSVFIGQL